MSGIKILSGSCKNNKLLSLDGQNTRPTRARVVENIFNILQHTHLIDNFDLHNQYVLDIYAGSGRLGLEALSRGAKYAAFIDHHPKAIAVIKENIEKCRLQEKTWVLKSDVLKLNKILPKYRFSLVFCDAPYEKNLCQKSIELLIEHNWLTPDALICIESEKNSSIIETQHLSHLDQRHYGISQINFYKYSCI